MKETEDRQAEFNSLVMAGFKKAEIMKTMRMSGHSYWKHMKYLKSLPVVKPADGERVTTNYNHESEMISLGKKIASLEEERKEWHKMYRVLWEEKRPGLVRRGICYSLMLLNNQIAHYSKIFDISINASALYTPLKID